jgi:hypothetical protein
MLKSVDLNVAAAVQNTETVLTNRRDTGIKGVSAEDGKPKVVKGIIGRENDAGLFIGRISGNMVFSISTATLNAMLTFMPLDIPVPAGEVLSVYVYDTAGTGAAGVTVLYEE